MFFFRILVVVLMIFIFFQTGETVNGSLIQTYNNLLNVDTGYSKKAHTELEEITEEEVTVAKEKIYSNLLCSYVFTCQYYMKLIKNLVDRASKEYFKDALRNDMINASYFQNQIVTMFYVLKHLGTVNSLDPLWLMYVYMDCLKILASNYYSQSIKNVILFTYDYEVIYKSFTNFTNDNCQPDNMFNYQYYEPDNYKALKKLSFFDKNADTLFDILFKDIIEMTDKRHTNIRQSLGIDNVQAYFVIEDLRLSHIMLDGSFMKILLDNFAEAKNRPDAYEKIQNYYIRNALNCTSVYSLVRNVDNCLSVFVNLTKYIIAHKAMKYVLDVHSTLPLSDENGVRSPEELSRWIRQSNLGTTNKIMFDHYNEIISFLKIDEDEDLKFVAEMFNRTPHITFRDPKENAENENRIKNTLVKFSKGLQIFPLLEISRADFASCYKSQRKEEVLNLAERLNVEIRDSNGYEYEGMLDLFLFKVFITRKYGATNFDIVHSFYEFKSNYFNFYCDNKNVSTSKSLYLQ